MTKAQTINGATFEVFTEDVGVLDQFEHNLFALGGFDVDRKAALVAIKHRKKARTRAHQLSGVIALKGFNFDDISPKVGQDHAASWAHHHVGELDDPDAFKW